MLALTPAPLQTAGERAVFAELTRWDTGGGVRAAVVASIPFGDGQLDRRNSDAVLLVPEGVAVVRIAEASRQSGVVTARTEGAWTIAPQAGPGDVLQLAGGGSTPLDGLMRAGMETAVRLRRAGLEPGRIARLTVVVGDVGGLVPADGDLGEGDQVALLEPRSLLLGIARCSRYSQVDNPRLWTTADVRAALEALGLPGRMPTVEELNGEGFPYSPYVLRRPELLAPAALSPDLPALPAEPVPAAVPVPAAATPLAGTPDAPPVREQYSPAAIAQALAASVAAGRAAEPVSGTAPVGGATPASGTAPVAGAAAAVAVAAPVAPPPAPGPATWRDTVAIDQPTTATGAAPGDVPAEPARTPAPVPAAVVPAPAVAAPAPAPAPAAPAPVPAPVPAIPVRAPAPALADTGGIGGLFRAADPVTDDWIRPVHEQAQASAAARPRTAVFAQPSPVAAPAPAPAVEHPSDGHEHEEEGEGSGRRTWLLAGLALVLVALVAVAGWLVLRDPDAGSPAAAAEAAPEAAPVASAQGPQAGDVQDVEGVRYTLQAVHVADSCVGHAYGDTATFFATTDCTGLSRALYSAQLEGGAVVVSVARVRMPDPATARDLQALTDRNGSGNVSDLLREGVTYPGGPAALSSAEYASAVSGPTVTIVESSWVDPASTGSSADVDRVAANGLALQVAPFTS